MIMGTLKSALAFGDRFSLKDMVLSHKRFLFILPVLLLLSFAAGQTDEQVYIIRKGDTLWDIAFRFLGDPFAWPQIWHQNPYIKDPNLIFPGDKLTIDKYPSGQQGARGASGPQGAPAGAPAGAAASAGRSSDDSFSSETKLAIEQSEALGKNALKKSGLEKNLSDSLLSAAMRRSGYLTSDFLGKAGFLWFNKDKKGLIYPGNAVIVKKENGIVVKRYEQETYQQYDNIVIQPFSAPAASYRVGDTVDIIHSYQFVKFAGRTANLVRRTAWARITEINGPTMTALLFKTWDVVQSGDRVDAMARFADRIVDTIVDPGVRVSGTVFLPIEQTERPYLYHTFILDRGSKDGVEFGDIFAVISGRVPTAGHAEAIACAVNISETSSTLVIEKLFDSNVAAGDTVVLVKRILFKK
jgi:hypothetical protein